MLTAQDSVVDGVKLAATDVPMPGGKTGGVDTIELTATSQSGVFDAIAYTRPGTYNYTLTEVQTDNGYTLLKNAIEVVITAKETETVCPTCGKALLTASATVNGKDVAMNEDNSSVHALVPLTVVNTKGFDLPTTGENGLWVYGVFGVLLMAAAIVVLVLAFRKKAQK